jgi:uncharacterized protein YbbC (DUF1343 family)
MQTSRRRGHAHSADTARGGRPVKPIGRKRSAFSWCVHLRRFSGRVCVRAAARLGRAALLLGCVMSLGGCGSHGRRDSGRAGRASSSIRQSAGRSGQSTVATSPTSSAVTVARTPVEVGLERVLADRGAPLRGYRVGLIANQASVTRDGRRSVDVLLASGVRVVRLFAPEHGFTGSQSAGASVTNSRDPRTGIPIVSLYGVHAAPTASDLRGIDALVFDLQDDGVRFYTYVSTMILAEDAASRAGIRFVVLDRPDPLGGEEVAGPVADPGQQSFTALAPGPLVYGLTAGEMARYIHAAHHDRGPLTVVPMTGWTREMTWSQTGRRWIPPSPNLRSPTAALLYPGTGLLEDTTATEGRGTADPFRIIGAPWVSPAALLRALAGEAGVRATPVVFTPTSSAAAPTPKYLEQRCLGIRLSVTASGVNTFALGLALLRALKRQAGFGWLQGGSALDSLLGTSSIRIALDHSTSVAAILASEASAVRQWREAIRPFLLYPSEP